jgi:hypothetical protein
LAIYALRSSLNRHSKIVNRKSIMPISRFESLARRLVEGSFKRLFGGQLEPLEIASHLARALEESQARGQTAVSFRVHLNPTDYETVYRQNPRLANDLATYVTQLAQQGGIILSTRPEIELTADPHMRSQQLRVETLYEQAALSLGTEVLERPSIDSRALAAIELLDAFLIVEGRAHIPLDRPIFTIGRRTDNDIVLDSAAISRQHAQIRWRFGRFVLFDLSRRGRTAVNEQTITEHALQPGDVITLSDIPFIYGEGRDGDEPRSSQESDPDAPTLLYPQE